MQEILGTVVMGPWGQDILHTEGQDAETLEHMCRRRLWVRQSWDRGDGRDILHTEGEDAQTLEHMLPGLWVRQS